MAQLMEPILGHVRKHINLQNKSDFKIKDLRELLRDDPVILVNEFDGVFEISKESDIFVRILAEGCYEPGLVKRALDSFDGQRDVIDVGANIGFYSVLLAKRVGGRRVLAVEPHPVVAARLARNLARNHVEDRVIIFQGLASDGCEGGILRSPRGREEYASAGRVLHPQAEDCQAMEATDVPSQTLDALADLHGLDVGFVKIDVEGLEFSVLNGAINIIAEHRPVILSELSNPLLLANGTSSKEVIEWIENFGYDVIDPLYPKLPAGFRDYGDILCVPRH